ncbi:MAG: methyltransferase domain-containing protein [Anaerolineales bacterium]|nr:methyltransferase domain-containing protein [Anaerolineales bacterium]
MTDRYERFKERYAAGQVPWDDTLPPPEVIAIVEALPPGRALDLGCGYGRSSIYLAQHGWQVDGVDFVAQAVAEAQHRARLAQVAEQVHFHQGSVADLHFLHAAYSLAIDVGCLHSLPPDEQATYRDGLLRLLSPGATYLLFARTYSGGTEPEGGPPSMADEQIEKLFGSDFQLTHVEKGVTQVEDQPVWTSAWFWFKRL